jgi:hypothetical protein
MAVDFQATGMERGKSIFIPDFDKLVKDLKKLDPQLRKDFDKALKAAAKPLVDTARQFVPSDIRTSSGGYFWKPVPPTYSTPAWVNDYSHRGRSSEKRWVWDAGFIKKNIKITKTTANKVPVGYNKVATAALAVVNRAPAGAIFELAGRGTAESKSRTVRVSRNPNASEDFLRALNKKYPFGGDARYGRILYRAAVIVAPEVRKQVSKVVAERLKIFARG